MANEKRLIDANALMTAHRKNIILFGRNAGKTRAMLGDIITELIYHAPTVDAVEVVRCKDCMWFDKEDELADVFRMERHCFCTEANNYVSENHFCSYGERRSDG